mgnify:CR=1 FL=1
MHPTLGEGQPISPGQAERKAALRAQLQAGRSERLPNAPAEAARTARALAACSSAVVVAAYLGRVLEPSTDELIDALWRSGVRVLLPVLTTEPSWAWYAGADHLRPGPRGIRQPDTTPMGAKALAEAEWIWLPGLAGTPAGARLGTGGGWYDRALPHADPAATRGLLLFDDEVLAELPTEPWDQPVDVLITERRRLDVAGNTKRPFQS